MRVRLRYLIVCLPIDLFLWYPEGNEKALPEKFNHGTLEALLMRWLKRDRWKADISITSMLLLLVFMVWVPLSAAGVYEVTPGLATPTTGTVLATPTVDPTMTALQETQLKQQIIQLQLQNDRSINAWLWNSIATFGTVVAALLQ